MMPHAKEDLPTARVYKFIARPPRANDPASIAFMHADLAKSGLVPDDIGAYPIASLFDGTGAYLIPYKNEDMYRTRHDRSINKYMQPRGLQAAWTSPHYDYEREPKPAILYLVEGEKKAARFLKRWPKALVVGIGGCWNWALKDGSGLKRFLPEIAALLRPGMEVHAIFDSDIQSNRKVQQAGSALFEYLNLLGHKLSILRPPTQKGIDDWLEACSKAGADGEIDDLVVIDPKSLALNKTQLYTALGCALDDGKLVLNESNAKRLLSDFLGPNIFNDKRLGQVWNSEVIDEASVEAQAIEYLQESVHFRWPVPKIRTGLSLVLSRQKDLVQERLRSIEWDGVERLDTWGSKYLEHEWPAYADEWGRILMTGLGLRILEPGTKVDQACILIGAQGIGKSTFFEDLSRFDGHTFYHACTAISGSGGDQNRTQGQMFARSLIVDLAEGAIFEGSRAAIDRAKQVITQTHDEFRIVYSRITCNEPRGFVFVGTTNRRDQLGDQTGSRRFLNLEVSHIKRLPYSEKLQILAEVCAKETALRVSPWYALRVTVDSAPERLRIEGGGQIDNVQELLNAQYHRPTDIEDFIYMLLDSGEAARAMKADPDGGHDLFITAPYIKSRYPDNSMSSNGIGRVLSGISTSKTSPWVLEKWKPVLTSLDFPTNLRSAYLQGIANHQGMLTGYRCKRRVSRAVQSTEAPLQEVSQE